MAAPPSKQSPSNQKMHGSDDGTRATPPKEARPALKDPPPSSVSRPATAGGATQADPPTYDSSESSERCLLARQLLNKDDFETALSLVEEQLAETTEAVRSALGPEGADLHEALAPLHYLYGTTLLYSLEEARGDAGAACVVAGGVADASANAETSAPPAAGDQDAEDIQIAWENLDAARAIVEAMLLAGEETLAPARAAKLRLDLAQIHLREGDLQRTNGNYTSAVGDYSRCLEILQEHNRTPDEKGTPRNLDRKIADTQFNLGLTYLTSSSDLQKALAGRTGKTEDPASEARKKKEAETLARDHCERGVLQQVDCAGTFCGILAGLCGADPETVLSATRGGGSPGPKTTGLDDGGAPLLSEAATAASRRLEAWRTAAAALVGDRFPEVAPSFGGEDHRKVLDLLQLLDEIQETIDEAERSLEGVRQAAEIRVRAQEAAEGKASEEQKHADGSTTTIGFGPATAVAATVASGASAKPVMVVKKKKKKRTGAGATEDGSPGKPAAENEASGGGGKRARTD
ncbi:unnamed protein product [Pseudo-nitzschia multistriata]|uniref:Tetratricopeptide SHNi-TPR domain-containing protein n=1 Tax=Pseudo-nitzschia multistriata TaxID=183589 RepID=A0A448ZIT1_9STRA|nr:unnamed protein product [Pseudo-nitzschia multistriata]